MERCCADQRCPSAGKKVSLPACSEHKGREGCPSLQLQGLLKCCRRDLPEPWRCTGALPSHLQTACYELQSDECLCGLSSSEFSYHYKE